MDKQEIIKRLGIKEEFYHTSPLTHAVVCILHDTKGDPLKLIGSLLERVECKQILEEENPNLLFGKKGK